VIGCHITLRGRWCDIIVLNVHAPTEDKCDDTKGFGDVDWIHWAQDRDRWRALMNTVMNLRVP
jgi:hypothetical protein